MDVRNQVKMNSGKFMVILILLAAGAMLVFSLWYTGSRSPLDQRFALNRTPAPLNQATIPPDYGAADKLLPANISAFVRLTLKPLNLAQPRPHGEAIYDGGNGDIQLTVDRIPASESPDDALNNAFVQAGATQVTRHADAKFPFVYVHDAASANTLIWVNGPWLITASSDQVDSEVLLLFANSYPY
jgi:hypothetical protein